MEHTATPRLFMTVLIVCTCLAVAGFAREASHREAAPLRGILARASAYVAQFERELGSLIAEERYLQEAGQLGGVSARPAPGRLGAGTMPPPAPETRTLMSEFLLLPLPAASGQWAGFRSVQRVNGRQVGDSETRFDLLAFRGSPETTLDAWRRLNEESARYNIGPVARTINVPTLALVVLRAENLPRFDFRVIDAADRVNDLDVVVVGYEEQTVPTLISDPAGTSVFASGRLWITPRDGRVVRTELVSRLEQHAKSLGKITVDYGRDARLSAWVPLRMEEEYFAGTVRVRCVAKYTNYRRFETDARIVPKA